MISSYKGFNFDLGETIDMLREQVNAFAASEIAPRAEQIDLDNEFPNELWPKLGEMGAAGRDRAGRVRRCRHGLSGACCRNAGDQPGLSVSRPVLRCSLQPMR